MASHFAERLRVSIHGRSYAIVSEEYRRTTVPVLREQFDNANNPGEQTLLTQMWVRSQDDWSHGAGQKVYDYADSDRLRFNTSAGVDPWTKGKLSLLPICESKNNANSWTTAIMRQVGGYTYVAAGTELYYTANIDAADASVTWTQVTPLTSPQTITDFCSDGTTVFIAYGAARSLTSTGVGVPTQPAALGALTPDYCRIIGERLIVFDNDTATEIDASGVAVGSSLAWTLPHGGTYVAGATGPAGVYLAANVNSTGSVFFVEVKTADGLLDSPKQVADLPRGETLNEMISYGGFLVLATSKGLRLGAIDQQSGGVTYGPVINDGGAANCLVADERFVWWGGSAGQVWRADLSVFTDTLVPAFASDLVSVGDGNSLGNVTDLIRQSGKTVFVDAGNGIQGEESTGVLVASGTLDTGSIRWNSQFDKALQTIEARIEPSLAIAGGITYDNSGYTYDDADLVYDGLWASYSGTVQARVTPDTGIASSLQTLENRVRTYVSPKLVSDSFTVTFTLSRDASATTAGPSLESWKIETFPAPTRIDEIVVPLVMRRRVATSRSQGAAATLGTMAEYDALSALASSKAVVTYREGSRSEQVVVDQLSMAVEKLTDDGAWWEGTLTVRLLTTGS